jgi:hypothetical protein
LIADNIDKLSELYNLPYHNNFCYAFIEFIDYKDIKLDKNKVEFHVKSPFIYYSRQMLILTYIRSYLKRDINNYGGLNNRSISDILRKVSFFNLNSEELIILKKKLRRLYKKSLN